jgi:amino acid transporter
VAGTFAAMLTVIFAAVPNFHIELLALPHPPPHENSALWLTHGLGAAMTIAVYDYLGYYNICFLGDEVKRPAFTIPWAVIGSIVIVAALYLLMNISILGVVPWQEAMKSTNIGADLMERLYGRPAAVGLAWLVVWTAMAGVFAMTLGYSRIPFAAARRGDFFALFGKLHPTGHYPIVSLLTFGGLTAICCFFPLGAVIDAAVAVRIMVQFIGQIIGLQILRTTRPDVPLPFRMWLYPLPSLIAYVGWLFLLTTSEWLVLATALGVTAAGLPVFLIWRRFAGGFAPPRVTGT